jgi:MFS family permease
VPLPPSLRPLKYRNYALFWTANLVSNIGTWMETVAVGALVARETGKASAVALAAASAFLPMALFAPIGGLIGDRVHRKRFLMATVTFDMTLAFVLAFLVSKGVKSPQVLSVVLFLEGCSSALSLPNRSALTPDLVPPEELLSAISLGSASWNGGRIFGPVVAGVVIALTNVSTALVLNAISFGVLVIAAFFIRIPDRRGEPDGLGVIARLSQGVTAVSRSSTSRLALGLVALMAFTSGPFIGLIPIVAEKVFGNAFLNTRLITAQGIGAVLGTLIGPSIAERIGRRGLLAGGFCVIPFAMLAYALAPNAWFAAAALIPVGACYFTVLTGSQTLLQQATPPELRARTAAIFSVSLGGAYVPAIALAGWAADRYGLRHVITVQAGLGAIAIVLVTLLRPRWWQTEQAEV